MLGYGNHAKGHEIQLQEKRKALRQGVHDEQRHEGQALLPQQEHEKKQETREQETKQEQGGGGVREHESRASQRAC